VRTCSGDPVATHAAKGPQQRRLRDRLHSGVSLAPPSDDLKSARVDLQGVGPGLQLVRAW